MLDVQKPNGMPVDIPRRDPRLPRFYLVESHDQVKPEWDAKRVFVYLQDTSAQAMEDYNKFLLSMTFPNGTKKAIKDAGMYTVNPASAALSLILGSGFMYLQRGDYVFCRDIHGSMEDADDVLQMWVPSE